MAGGTTIVDRLNKLSGKDATTIAKALENLEEGGGIGGFEIHICASGEYDAETKVPIIEEPDTSTLYLVPTSSKSKNMFDEYVWTGTDWEKFGTGSVALPSPTTSDNGKVLGVDGGEYKLVEQSGGGDDVFVVTFTGSLSGNLSADKTFDEMEQAALSGKVVIGHYDGSGAGYSLSTYYLSEMNTSKGSADASFTRSYAYASGSQTQASIATIKWVKSTGAITSRTATITA